MAAQETDRAVVKLGRFDTAVEAAVAYARAVGEYQPPAPPTVAAEAEGLRLHLSSSNPSGYKGVVKLPSGGFKAQHRVDGRKVHVGSFDTAVEAAVAYARAVGEPPERGSSSSAAAAATASSSGAGSSASAAGAAAASTDGSAAAAPSAASPSGAADACPPAATAEPASGASPTARANATAASTAVSK